MPLALSRLLTFAAAPKRVPTPTPSVTEPPEGPAAPSGLVATPVSGTQINLAWTDNSNNELGFAIDRAAVSGPGTFFDTVGPDVTGYSDVNVNPGETWFYHVRAFNDAGSSGVSNEASTTTPTVGDLNPDFFAPSGNIIEAQSYDLRSRVLNPDQTIHTNYVVADWDFSFPLGGAAVIGGPNSDVLTPDAGSAPVELTVRASYVGAETLNPTFEDKAFNVIVQPTGNFPVILDPGASFTTIASFNGSTKDWSPEGWHLGTRWLDDNAISVVSDPASKFGNAIEKRIFIGDEGGWLGTANKQIGLWSQLYVRMVFAYSNNWQWHPSGGKHMYLHNSGIGAAKRIIILGPPSNQQAAKNAFGIEPTVARSVRFVDALEGSAQWVPNLEGLSRGEYHTFETLIGADMGTNDGFLRQAVDGIEATQWVRVGPGGEIADLRSGRNWEFNNNVSDKRLGRLCEVFTFWGGSGEPSPVNCNIRLSELFISGLS